MLHNRKRETERENSMRGGTTFFHSCFITCHLVRLLPQTNEFEEKKTRERVKKGNEKKRSESRPNIDHRLRRRVRQGPNNRVSFRRKMHPKLCCLHCASSFHRRSAFIRPSIHSFAPACYPKSLVGTFFFCAVCSLESRRRTYCLHCHAYFESESERVGILKCNFLASEFGAHGFWEDG